MDKAEFLDNYLENMVQNLLNQNEIEFMQSVQDFCREYHPEDIPRPKDKNTTRLALKASIVERLVEIMNGFPRNMNEKAPAWCATIGPGKHRLNLAPEDVLELETEFCEPFLKRNIYAIKNFMFYI